MTDFLQIRIDTEDKERWKAFAKSKNISMANLIKKSVEKNIFEARKEERKMVELTIVNTRRTDGNGDQFPEIKAIGYEAAKAKDMALSELRYACCSDFSRPSTCRPGTTVEYFKAFGVKLTPDMDEDEIAKENGWNYAVTMTFKKEIYALSDNYDEFYEGGTINSADVRKCDHWDEV